MIRSSASPADAPIWNARAASVPSSSMTTCSSRGAAHGVEDGIEVGERVDIARAGSCVEADRVDSVAG